MNRCDAHSRLLSLPEMEAEACWWCHPDKSPDSHTIRTYSPEELNGLLPGQPEVKRKRGGNFDPQTGAVAKPKKRRKGEPDWDNLDPEHAAWLKRQLERQKDA